MNLMLKSCIILLFAYETAISFVSSLDNCQYVIVESMPEKMVFDSPMSFKPKPTHESLIELINNAKSTLRIASFYVFLMAEPKFADHPSAEPGKKIMDSILAATKRGVDLEVILDHSNKNYMSNMVDVNLLKSVGKVKNINMTQLLHAGVLHTKFLIADNQSLYIGSSNFDWRSYSQIKEIGIEITDCQTIASDLDKIFQTYMMMADLDQVPDSLPNHLSTQINLDNPFHLNSDQASMELFLASSPPAFNGLKQWIGRTDDIDALIKVIDNARHKIDISVMNYSPATEFGRVKKFWPRIDNALRRAVSERRVKVRLLFSNWTHTKPEEIMWYRSLDAVQSSALRGGGIQVKMFRVPAFDDFEKSIPYSRVKHDKYMVTDDELYIGTSNWSPDYFMNTCGVSVNIAPNKSSNNGKLSIVKQMQELFERDFSSGYSQDLPMFD